MKRTIAVTLAEAEKYDAGFPPEGAIEFSKWLGDLMAQVPAEHAETAKLEIDSIGSYENSHYATVSFTYTRPETDAEEAERLAADMRAVAVQRSRELQQLDALRRKYEGGT